MSKILPDYLDKNNVTDDDYKSMKYVYTNISDKYKTLAVIYFLNTIWDSNLRYPLFSDKYEEMYIDTKFPDLIQMFNNMNVNRYIGFSKDELNIYWSYNHISKLINYTKYINLLKNPVKSRVNNNNGKIIMIENTSIIDAIFMVPKDKQIIVLVFANEVEPGGGILRNSSQQEETILKRTDAYRGLLDIKYRLMHNGYLIPEYGVNYIKNVGVFSYDNLIRTCDLIFCAAYDMSNHNSGLYKKPASSSELYDKTYQKIKSIIASAVANSKDNGSDTYLLLGPIGTGVFKNPIDMIAKLFYNILNNQMMDSLSPIRYVFNHIWFVSTGQLDAFKKLDIALPFPSTPSDIYIISRYISKYAISSMFKVGCNTDKPYESAVMLYFMKLIYASDVFNAYKKKIPSSYKNLRFNILDMYDNVISTLKDEQPYWELGGSTASKSIVNIISESIIYWSLSQINNYPITRVLTDRRYRNTIDSYEDNNILSVFKYGKSTKYTIFTYCDINDIKNTYSSNSKNTDNPIYKLMNCSNLYYAILKTKYEIMKYDFIIPEFGVVYIKNVEIYKDDITYLCDVILAQLYNFNKNKYDMLYDTDSNIDILRDKLIEKSKSIVASAILHSELDNAFIIYINNFYIKKYGDSIKIMYDYLKVTLDQPLLSIPHARDVFKHIAICTTN